MFIQVLFKSCPGFAVGLFKVFQEKLKVFFQKNSKNIYHILRFCDILPTYTRFYPRKQEGKER